MENALQIAEQTEDITWQCTVLVNYSQVLRRAGQFAEAASCCMKAQKHIKHLPAKRQAYVRADIEDEMGRIARDSGDWQTAKEYFSNAHQVFREDEPEPIFNLEIAWGLKHNLGFIEHQLGNLETAAQMYSQALNFFREYGSKGTLTILLARFAKLEEQRTNHAEALQYAKGALEWSTRLGMVKEQAQAKAIIARLEGDAA